MPGNKSKRLPPDLEVPACRQLALWLCAEAAAQQASSKHEAQALVSVKKARAVTKREIVWEPTLFVRVGQQTAEVQALLRSWSNRPARVIWHSPDGKTTNRRYRSVLPAVLEQACSEDAQLLSAVEEAIYHLHKQTWRRTERIVGNVRITADGPTEWFEEDKHKGKGEDEE